MNKFLLFTLFILGVAPVFAQNALDNAGLSSAAPSSVAYSLRKLSSTYSGPVIKARRSSDNAEATVLFDGSNVLSAASMATFLPGVAVSAAFGTLQAGSITTDVGKTGTVTIKPNKTGTIMVTTAQNVTGTGTSFTTELVAGDRLFNAANNVLIGVVATVTSNTELLLVNNSTIITSTGINFKTTTASVTGTGTNFTAELAPGDRLFNNANSYLGTVATIASTTSLTINAVDAVAATSINFKSTSLTVAGTGTNFTALSPGDLLISNNTTLGIIASITNNTSLTLNAKAGAAVTGLAYKTTAGTIPFGTFYAATSAYVKTWYDQSGNGRDAIQLKPGNQPRIVNAGTLYNMGGRTSTEFSGVFTSFLQTASVASYFNNSAYTLSKVTAEGSVNPANQFPLTTTGGGGLTNSILHFGYRSLALLTLAQLNHDHTFNATPGTRLEAHLAVKPSEASSQMYKNGISLGIVNTGAAAYLQNVGLLNIGCYIPTNVYYDGAISEIIAFPAALSSADIGLLNNSQIAFYSIPTNAWTGNISTQWGDAGNWSAGVVPNATSAAIAQIPAGRPLYPIINGTTPVNSVSVDAGASLTITGTLQVAGTINTLGSCTATSGTVEYIGLAQQSIGANAFTGNIVQRLIVSNSAGVSLNTNFSASGNLTLATGKLSMSNSTLTLGGTVTNTISGGLTGGTNSGLIVSGGTASPTLSFDQTYPGSSNSLKSFTLNSSGQVVYLSNNLQMNVSSVTTFTAGKLAIGNNTLTIRGSIVNTVNEALTGSAGSNLIMDGPANATLSVDQSTPGTTNALNNLTINNGTQTISLNRSLVVASTLNITTGILADGGNQLTSTGTINLSAGTFKLGSSTVATIWPAFTTNNISTGGTVEYASGLMQTASAIPAYQNLTISAAAGVIAGGNLAVNGVLNLSAANPSTTKGSLSMGNDTLNMGAQATTIGQGDVTGIVRRTTILPGVTYTMGNEFTSITFPNTGTLPTQIGMKISIGAVPVWRAGAIKRTYDFIQTGGTGTKAIINSHYLDAELNGNIESKLVDFSNQFTGPVLTEHGKSNFNTTQNWTGLSNVNVAFFSAAFGNAELSQDETSLTALTWNGSTSTSWITATNWTPNGGPSTNTILIIPDAATTPNDPYLPATASNGSLTIESGGILNADPGAQLMLNNSGLAWSNTGGTFNASTSTIIFTDANATINGTTNFYTLIINSNGGLLMTTGNVMRIAGTLTNNGAFRPGILENTVEYNGNNQTITLPNSSSGAYHNLILNGTGTMVLPAAALNILGDLTINGTVATTGNTISMNGSNAQAINGANPLALTNLTINNSAGAVTLNQNLTVANSLTFSAGKLSIGNHTLGVAGNVINTIANGITGGLSSNIIVTGTASPTLSFDQSTPGTSNALNNFTINSTAQIPLLGSDLEVDGTLLFTAGKLGINGHTLALKGAVINTATEGLRGGNTSSLIIAGAASPALSFDQTTPGITNLLNNFSINSAGHIATLANPLIVGGVLGLTTGHIITSTANSLTLTASAAFTGGSDTAFVDGPLVRNTNAAADFMFPIGKANIYRPVSVTPTAAAPGVYNATYYPSAAPAGTYATEVTGVAANEYWDIHKASGPDAKVTLNYAANNTWSQGSPAGTDNIFVAHLNAGTWERASRTGLPGNTGGGTSTPIPSNILSSFSPFTFGYSAIASTPLPLILVDFQATQAQQTVHLAWTTTNEYALAGFELERSADGNDFSRIGTVAAANTAQLNRYDWTDDAPLTGQAYYRLKMLDLDGAHHYSIIRKIQIKAEQGISVYPNPLIDRVLNIHLQGQVRGEYSLNIYTSTGQNILSQKMDYDGVDGIKRFHLDDQITGTLYIEMASPNQVKTVLRVLAD